MEKDNDRVVAHAVIQLASVFEPETTVRQDGAALYLVLGEITRHLGIALNRPEPFFEKQRLELWLNAIAQTSHFRIRKVVLRGLWWKFDNGPLLVLDKTTQKPYALIQEKSGGYRVFDPQTRQFLPLTSELRALLSLNAYSFYRTFPDKKLRLRDLVFFSLQGQKFDITRLLLLQVFIGLLGLFIPIATGVILDGAVPNANLSLLAQFFVGLLVSSFAVASFSATQMLSIIRLRFKINRAIQPAVWDRLLRLAPTFFRQYSPGDLALRASGIDTIQQELSYASLSAFIGGLFSLFTFALMFYYSAVLAAWSVVLVGMVVLLISVSNIILLKYQRPILQLQGKLSALSFQLLTSISKLRVSNSELRAFGLWAEQFSKKNHFFWQYSLWAIRFTILRSIFSVLIFLWLYAMVGGKVVALSFGIFIAFNAAFSQFFMALLALAGVVAKSIDLIPLYERIQPILHAIPEKEEGISGESLRGTIELRNLSFRYAEESPLVLDNMSLQIHAGEFIALVGSTGCGKSTVFRLLLGFERPSQGNIFYDDLEISKFNIRELRKKLGVVLQNSTLLSGTIFENIMGTEAPSVDEAWEAAELAGIAKDIKAMPMGMHTLLVEGGKTLSVGQRQRLMIARALAGKPRILLFDEATSALDNPTQMQIMRNMENLKITRVVAAHRLSTLMHADCIYVMDKGHIVQRGTYEELLNQDGIFTALVQQQII